MSAMVVLGTRGWGVELGPVAVISGLSMTSPRPAIVPCSGTCRQSESAERAAFCWQRFVGTGTNSAARQECRHGDQIWPPDRSPFRPHPGGDVGPARPHYPAA